MPQSSDQSLSSKVRPLGGHFVNTPGHLFLEGTHIPDDFIDRFLKHFFFQVSLDSVSSEFCLLKQPLP